MKMIKKILTKFNNIPSFSFLKKDKKSGVGKKSLEKKIDFKTIIEKQKNKVLDFFGKMKMLILNLQY